MTLTRRSVKTPTLAQRLAALKSSTDEVKEGSLRNLLRDPFLRVDLPNLQEIYQVEAERGSSPKLVGGLGFLMFQTAAELHREAQLKDSAPTSVEVRTIADTAIAEKPTRDFVTPWYELAPVLGTDGQLRFLTTGTTSFVLVLRFPDSDTTRVLKILKPRFSESQSITERTEAYGTAYPAGVECAPTVIDSGKCFVLMQHVKGQTLADYVRERTRNGGLSGDEVRGVLVSLCRVLEYLESIGIHHGDLNPTNIIVDPTDTWRGSTPRIWLIDFGVNYLITDRIGSTGDVAKASVYVAPEVLENPQSVSTASDVYSLGAIALELCSVDMHRGRFDAREFESYLDEVRHESPGLAALLDDMLEPKPQFRLADLQFRAGQDDTSVFIDLRKLFEFYLAEGNGRSTQPGNPVIRMATRGLEWISLDFGGSLQRLLSQAAAHKTVDEEVERLDGSFRGKTGSLPKWALLASLGHLLVLIALVDAVFYYQYAGQLGQKWPGLVICASFSFVALQYYREIFSEIYAGDLGRLGKVVEIWLRFSAVYWWPVIVATYIIEPEAWGIATCFGTGVVAINNLLTYRLARRASARIERTFKTITPSRIKDALAEYSAWGVMMGLYAGGLLLIGSLFWTDRLKDIEMFVGATMIVNLKLWLFNSTRSAPMIRNMLQYLYAKLRRVQLVDAAAEGNSGAVPTAPSPFRSVPNAVT
jgi:predicted Ser/Thr protein kinase